MGGGVERRDEETYEVGERRGGETNRVKTFERRGEGGGKFPLGGVGERLQRRRIDGIYDGTG